MKNENEKQEKSQVKAVQFSQIQEKAPSNVPSSIDLLKDVPLTVTAELGRTKMMVKDILKLGVGAVIELEKEAGEAVDILVNNKLIARGEVVEIDGNFGVRIIEVINR
ncbi:MAG: flagellar motor switch protein FliN [Armatimonadota bacterium]